MDYITEIGNYIMKITGSNTFYIIYPLCNFSIFVL